MAISSNFPQQLLNNQTLIDNQNKVIDTIPVQVIVRPDFQYPMYNKYHGIVVFVYNASTDTMKFYAQDSQLYMLLQARNQHRKWQDIMYISHSDCGNSYHKLQLEPQFYWKFLMPKYEGAFSTKLRVKLQYIDLKDSLKQSIDSDNLGRLWGQKKELTVYSNEFDGNINPAQFWRKEKRYRTNFMEPYYYE